MPPDGLAAHHTLTIEKPRHSRAAKIPQPDQPPRHVPFDVPGFSIELLGRQLALSGHREHLLEEAEREKGDREIFRGKGAISEDQAKRVVASAKSAVEQQTAALEALILNSRPVTVMDVVVQLVVSNTYVSRAEGTADEVEREKCLDALRRVLSSAARILGEAHAISLAEIGGAHWASHIEDDWPDVELGHIRITPEPPQALDGSLTEWAR